MRHKFIVIYLALATSLSACGKSELSFKNSDTFLKSYNELVSDMTEIERKSFSTNLILILNNDKTVVTNLGIKDWSSAVRQAKQLATMPADHPYAKEFASDLAIKGAESLDGKTVDYVNVRAEEIKSNIQKSLEIKALITIDELNNSIGQLEKDKVSNQDQYDKALTAETLQIKKTSIYNPSTVVKLVEKKSAGVVIKGEITITNPHPKIMFDVNPVFHIRYKDYTARHNFNFSPDFNRPKSKKSGNANFSFLLKAKDFINNKGQPLDKEYNMPSEISAYDVIYFPELVRTNAGWKKYQYALNKRQSRIIERHQANVKKCDQLIEKNEKLIANQKVRIETIKAKKFDKLRNIRVRYNYNKSCL